MTGLSLYQMADEYLSALQHLRESDIDDQTIADTLEGLEGELVQKAQNVAAFAMNMEAEADALKAAEKRLADRRRAIEKKSAKMREYLLMNMEKSGITEIKAIDDTFRVRLMAGRQSVVIDSDESIPKEYRRIKTIDEPDKVALAKALKDGEDIPGASLVRKPQLKID